MEIGSNSGRTYGLGAELRDRTTVARIRDAALEEFGALGVGKATLKSIAVAAGVTPQLVVHHFGSKDGLASACDSYVLAVFREHDWALVRTGDFSNLEEHVEAPVHRLVLGYVAARLVDDSPAVVELVDEAINDAVASLKEGVRSGVVKKTDYPFERAVIGMLWQLGAVVLHRHAKRLLDIDLISGGSEERMLWSLVSAEILSRGMLDETVYDALRETNSGMKSADDAANEGEGVSDEQCD